MFSFPMLIVIVAALAATGLTALGLRLFFRVLETGSPDDGLTAAGEQTPAGE